MHVDFRPDQLKNASATIATIFFTQLAVQDALNTIYSMSTPKQY